jgi:hypothetical protein
VNLGDRLMEPVLEIMGRFDDILPSWMVKYKRWTGIFAVGSVFALALYFVISCFNIAMQE